jgi:hypothetical protein
MGNALLGIVQLQLKTGAQIEEIVELLGSIQDDLNDQQDAADEERVVRGAYRGHLFSVAKSVQCTRRPVRATLPSTSLPLRTQRMPSPT